MKIVIRADSSARIGSGHIMRCLALAECLQGKGAEVSFICRDLPGNIAYLAKQRGFPVYWLTLTDNDDWAADAYATAAIVGQGQPPEWLIVDQYALDARWERILKPFVHRIMTIDDMANRKHDCDILLDVNFYPHPEGRYEKIVPLGTRLLLGPQYALLRSGFSQVERRERHNGIVKRVLAFFGGSDPTNETKKLLAALRYLPNRSFVVDVVVGAGNPLQNEIERQCASLENVRFFCQVNNLEEIMAQADLAIGAGGITLWERCYLGVPGIIIAVADNQVETAQALDALGAIHYLGFHTEVNEVAIASAFLNFIAKPDTLLLMSRKAKEVVRGGGTEAVVREMIFLAGTVPDGISITAENVLITSASKKIPLLQLVKKAIAKLNGSGKLIAADSNKDCLARYFADDFWQMPALGILTEDVLLAELKRREVRYIIPTRDGELLFWSKRRAWLQREGIDVMVSAPEAVAACIDKLEFYQLCRKLDIPAIATSLKPEDLEAERFVVKDRYGAGAQRIGINLTAIEALQHAENLEYPVFQPFVAGTEYSVDTYVNQHGQVKGVICRTRDLVVHGEAQVTTTARVPELERLCATYIKQLGLFGHIVLQLIIDKQGQPQIIECNSRFGGASTLSVSAGLDSFYWFFIEAQGQSLDNHLFTRSPKQLRQVRFPHDLVQEVD